MQLEMGWSTDLFCTVSFSKATYLTKEEVMSDLEECNRLIAGAKSDLRDLAFITEPNKYYDSENESPFSFVDGTYRDAMEILDEYMYRKFKLELLLNNWDDCHTVTGDPIEPPENVHYDSAFIRGEFIKKK